MSSDAEDASQPPCPSHTQTPPLPNVPQVPPAHVGGSPGFPDLTPIPPQSLPPLPPQIPEASSPHEVENMMDVDDTIQHSPPPPSPPPPPPSIPLPQADLAVDAIGRTLSNVTVTSSPVHPVHPSHALDFVEDSEPEAGSPTEAAHDGGAPQATPTPSVENIITQAAESDDDFHPPPPTSPSSQSHHTSLSRHPTPTVRGLLYGGPNGIFRDANTSILQHIWAALPQNTTSSPPALPPNIDPDREPEVQLPSTTDVIIPPVLAITQVNHSILHPKLLPNPSFRHLWPPTPLT